MSLFERRDVNLLLEIVSEPKAHTKGVIRVVSTPPPAQTATHRNRAGRGHAAGVVDLNGVGCMNLP